MRLIFTSIMTLFLLTACGTAAPQVTVTSQVTVTLTPAPTASATPTVTFTPTPAFSPEVDMIIADETTLPEVGAFLTAAKEAGYSAELNADGTIKMEGDLNIDPLTGKTKTSHPLTLDDGRIIQVPTTGQVGVDVTIETDAAGNVTIKTPAWKYEKSGEEGEGAWVRGIIKFDESWEYTKLADATRGLEAEIPVNTREEFMAAVLSENAWLEATGQMGDDSAARISIKRENRKMIGFDDEEAGIQSHGINFYAPGHAIDDNEMYRSRKGLWVGDVSTALYVYTYLPEQRVTIVRWRSEGGIKEMMVAGNWEDDVNDEYGNAADVYKQTKMSFFNFEEGSEFDLTFPQQ